MSDQRKGGISWTNTTWNAIRGCSRVSSGCTRCYAEAIAARFSGPGQPYEGLAKRTPSGPRWTGQVRLIEEHLLDPLRWKRPRRIFVNSMSDLFHEALPDEVIDRVFAVMALAPQHTFQVLTKRPERMLRYCSDEATPFRISRQMDSTAARGCDPEEIREIAGYPGYFASSLGFIYSDKRQPRRRMKPDVGEQGHRRVQLHREGGDVRGDRHLVHRLILETFIGPPPQDDSQGCHRDGDPSNNAVSNLAWGSQSDNWSDSKRHGSHRRYCKLTTQQAEEIRKRHASGESGASLGRAFGISDTQARNIATGRQWSTTAQMEWPLHHCWLGVSVEDQATADERIPLLLQTPAPVRWVSAEPLLGPITFRWRSWIPWKREPGAVNDHLEALKRLDWVVCGGESGPRARPMHPDWARSLRDQCAAAAVPFFFKQRGEWSWDKDGGGDTEPTHLICGCGSYFANDHNGGNVAALDHRCGRSSGMWYAINKPGKRAAGDLLDGAQHHEYPEGNDA